MKAVKRKMFDTDECRAVRLREREPLSPSSQTGMCSHVWGEFTQTVGGVNISAETQNTNRVMNLSSCLLLNRVAALPRMHTHTHIQVHT